MNVSDFKGGSPGKFDSLKDITNPQAFLTILTMLGS
jgi:hypothetical protein